MNYKFIKSGINDKYGSNFPDLGEKIKRKIICRHSIYLPFWSCLKVV